MLETSTFTSSLIGNEVCDSDSLSAVSASSVPPIVTSEVSLLFPMFIDGGLPSLVTEGLFGVRGPKSVGGPVLCLSARIVSLATWVEGVDFRGQVPYQLDPDLS